MNERHALVTRGLARHRRGLRRPPPGEGLAGHRAGALCATPRRADPAPGLGAPALRRRRRRRPGGDAGDARRARPRGLPSWPPPGSAGGRRSAPWSPSRPGGRCSGVNLDGVFHTLEGGAPPPGGRRSNRRHLLRTGQDRAGRLRRLCRFEARRARPRPQRRAGAGPARNHRQRGVPGWVDTDNGPGGRGPRRRRRRAQRRTRATPHGGGDPARSLRPLRRRSPASRCGCSRTRPLRSRGRTSTSRAGSSSRGARRRSPGLAVGHVTHDRYGDAITGGGLRLVRRPRLVAPGRPARASRAPWAWTSRGTTPPRRARVHPRLAGACTTSFRKRVPRGWPARAVGRGRRAPRDPGLAAARLGGPGRPVRRARCWARWISPRGGRASDPGSSGSACRAFAKRADRAGRVAANGWRPDAETLAGVDVAFLSD